MKHQVETKSYEKSNTHANENYEQSPEHTGTDEDDSDKDSDENSRFGFQRTVEDEAPLKNKNITEAIKRLNYAKNKKHAYYRAWRTHFTYY